MPKAGKPETFEDRFHRDMGGGYMAIMTEAELEARKEFERKKQELDDNLHSIGLLRYTAELWKLERETNRKIDEARRSGAPETVTKLL